MRIIGTIEHPVLKISIFSWNEKYIVKAEAGFFEQIYKFRQDDFAGVDQIKEFFDESFLNEMLQTFKKMSSDASAAARRFQTRGGIA